MALAARLLLAIVLAVAAATKLVDPAGSRRALVGFGVSEIHAPPLAAALPLAELGIAAGLLLGATAWWAAATGALLVVTFSLAVGYNLARGRRPDCHCFGRLSAGPIGPSTLGRNALVLGVAGFILWQGRAGAAPGIDLWITDRIREGDLAPVAAATFILLLAGTVFAYGPARRSSVFSGAQEMLRAALGAPRPGLPVGSPAPDFRLASVDADPVGLEDLRALGEPVLLVFLSPDCPACGVLLPALARWQREFTPELTIALITYGDIEVHRTNTDVYGLTYTLLDDNHEVARAYRTRMTPSAVLVTSAGVIGSALAEDGEAIRLLVEEVSHRSATVVSRPTAARVGEPAPPVRIRTVDRRLVDLAEFRGHTTALLFWNPGCGYCQQLLGAIRDWEANPPPQAPTLLVLSRGSYEAGRRLGLRSTVALDHGLEVSAAFGVRGTPSAVLVDAEGVIASGVARGVRSVQALLAVPLDRRVYGIPVGPDGVEAQGQGLARAKR